MCCCRLWAKNPWNLAEAVIVLGSLATVMTRKGETREVSVRRHHRFSTSQAYISWCHGSPADGEGERAISVVPHWANSS